MASTNTESELRALRDLVEQLENSSETERKQHLIRRIFLSAGYAGLVIGFIFAWHNVVHVVLASVLIALAGASVGIGVFLSWSIKQWPLTIRFVDLERLKRRIRELEI